MTPHKPPYRLAYDQQEGITAHRIDHGWRVYLHDNDKLVAHWTYYNMSRVAAIAEFTLEFGQ